MMLRRVFAEVVCAEVSALSVCNFHDGAGRSPEMLRNAGIPDKAAVRHLRASELLEKDFALGKATARQASAGKNAAALIPPTKRLGQICRAAYSNSSGHLRRFRQFFDFRAEPCSMCSIL